MFWRRHQHQMNVVDTYYLVSGPALFGGLLRTVALRRCGCGELDTVTLDGKWDRLQLQGCALGGAIEDEDSRDSVPVTGEPARQ